MICCENLEMLKNTSDATLPKDDSNTNESKKPNSLTQIHKPIHSHHLL